MEMKCETLYRMFFDAVICLKNLRCFLSRTLATHLIATGRCSCARATLIRLRLRIHCAASTASIGRTEVELELSLRETTSSSQAEQLLALLAIVR